MLPSVDCGSCEDADDCKLRKQRGSDVKLRKLKPDLICCQQRTENGSLHMCLFCFDKV